MRSWLCITCSTQSRSEQRHRAWLHLLHDGPCISQQLLGVHEVGTERQDATAACRWASSMGWNGLLHHLLRTRACVKEAAVLRT